jgi:ribosomal protein S6E (S10)
MRQGIEAAYQADLMVGQNKQSFWPKNRGAKKHNEVRANEKRRGRYECS